MKSSYIKYVFIIFIVILIIIAIYIIRKNEEEDKREKEYIEVNEEENQIREIKLGIAEFDTINPILSNNKNVQDISKLIYDPLITLTQDYKAKSCLAVEWAREQNNSYIIKLKENVKWSSGQKFTAYDVKYTIDMLKQSQSIYKYNVQNIIGVTVIDDYTIRIKLDKEIAFFEYNLTFPIISRDNFEGQDFFTSEKNKNPIGTGKYKIKDIQSSYIELEKNLNWWDKETKLNINKITVNLYSSIGELYNSFKLGNLDEISTENPKIKDYIGTIGYNPKEIKGRNHTYLAINTTNNILSRQEVRQAILYSIDVNNIQNTLENKVIQSDFPLDYGNGLYQNMRQDIRSNQEVAKQILVNNGWIYKNAYWQKTENYKTNKIQFKLLVKSSDNEKTKVAENIKNQLEIQGIRANIKLANDEEYYNLLDSRNYDIALSEIILSPSPSLETFLGASNLANYNNIEVNNILEEVKNTKDESIIIEKYKRIIEIFNTEVPYISLYNNKLTVAYNSGLSGKISTNWFNQFYGIETWYK